MAGTGCSNYFDKKGRCYCMKIVLVGAGKGGTGKTTATANIGKALSVKHKVGLLDLDVMGPNLPRIVGIMPTEVNCDMNWFYPEKYSQNLEVFSPAFLYPPDVAIAWSGDKRRELIHELIEKVKWDNPDVLICDCPPGTADEITAVLQYMPHVDGAIIVTNGKRESLDDARRLISLFRNKLYNVNIFGAIENMGYIQTEEGDKPLFRDVGVDIESELGLNVLVRIPWMPVMSYDIFSPVADVINEKLKLNSTGE